MIGSELGNLMRFWAGFLVGVLDYRLKYFIYYLLASQSDEFSWKLLANSK
jgi:hypothetical protein